MAEEGRIAAEKFPGKGFSNKVATLSRKGERRREGVTGFRRDFTAAVARGTEPNAMFMVTAVERTKGDGIPLPLVLDGPA